MQIPPFFIRWVTRTHSVPMQTIGNLYGGALVLLITLLNTSSSSLVHGMPRGYHSFQLLFIEYIFCWGMFCLLFARSLKEIVRTRKPHLQCLRVVCNILGTFFLFEALKRLPLAINSALSLFSIVLSVLGSSLIFREKPNRMIIIGLAFALVGFLCLSRFHCSFSNALYLPILAAMAFSTASLTAKKLALFDSLHTLVFWQFTLQVILCGILCVFVWKPVSAELIWRMGGTALIIFTSIPLTLQAESFAAMAFLAPFKCLRILFSTVFGWLFFSEKLAPYDWIGIACILLAHLVLVRQRNNITSYYIRSQKKS